MRANTLFFRFSWDKILMKTNFQQLPLAHNMGLKFVAVIIDEFIRVKVTRS